MKKINIFSVTLLALQFAIFFFAGCATTEKIPTGLVIQSESEYYKTVEDNTQQTQEYDGLYSKIDLRGTLLNTKVSEAQVDQNARMYLWDKAKYEAEFFKVKNDLDKESKVFISLFTPEKQHNDLNKKNSVWKIFLDVNGKRYEGTATKSKQLLKELNSYYPYHTQFATPYVLTFPISMKSVEGQKPKLILTGPIGSVYLNFN